MLESFWEEGCVFLVSGVPWFFISFFVGRRHFFNLAVEKKKACGRIRRSPARRSGQCRMCYLGKRNRERDRSICPNKHTGAIPPDANRRNLSRRSRWRPFSGCHRQSDSASISRSSNCHKIPAGIRENVLAFCGKGRTAREKQSGRRMGADHGDNHFPEK